MPARCPRIIIRKARNLYGSGFLNGGGGGIRTHGTRERTTVFKTAPINRSGTPPDKLNCNRINLNRNKIKSKAFVLRHISNVSFSSIHLTYN